MKKEKNPIQNNNDNNTSNSTNPTADIEIVMGDNSELKFSPIKDSIKTLRPKDKVQKDNIIIPRTKKEREKRSKVIKP